MNTSDAVAPQIDLVGCNNDATMVPEMAVKIRQTYFEDFLSHETGFTLNNGFYERAFASSDLQLSFPEDGESEYIISMIHNL